MRKRSRYRPGPVHAWLPKAERTTIEIMSRVIVDKLAAGLFDEIDSNTVGYELNICRRLAAIGGHEAAIKQSDACIAAFVSIRQRQIRTGKWGATGDEFQTLRQHLGDLADYFSRQPVHRIESARRWVLAVNEKMKVAGVISADVGEDMRLENRVSDGLISTMAKTEKDGAHVPIPG